MKKINLILIPLLILLASAKQNKIQKYILRLRRYVPTTAILYSRYSKYLDTPILLSYACYFSRRQEIPITEILDTYLDSTKSLSRVDATVPGNSGYKPRVLSILTVSPSKYNAGIHINVCTNRAGSSMI